MDHPTPPAYRSCDYAQQVERGQNQESLQHLDVEAQANHEATHQQPAQPTGFDCEYEDPSRQKYSKDQ
jgi:hypothetical protein